MRVREKEILMILVSTKIKMPFSIKAGLFNFS